MKKISTKVIGVFLTAVMLFGSLAAVSHAKMDGYALNVNDARAVLRAAVSLSAINDTDVFLLADFDFDSKMTVNDARAILRISVKTDVIDGKTYKNEYEMLSSGFFGFSCFFTERTENGTHSGNLSGKMAKDYGVVKLGIDGIAQITGTDMDEMSELLGGFDDFIPSSFHFSNTKISICSDSTKQALSVPANDFGDDFGDIGEITNELIPALHKSLDEAATTKNATYNNKPCRVYIFNETDANGAKYCTNVYMDGKKLLKIDYTTTIGSTFKSIEFKSVSRAIPVSDITLSGYEIEDLSGLISMF